MRSLPLKIYRNPLTFLIIFTLIGVASFNMTRQLTLDADLAALLPESFESVQDLDRVKERFGGLGYVIVVATETTPDAMRRFADDLAISVEPLDDVSFVDYKRPTSFYKDRVFYYLETEDLKYVHKQMKKRWKWEKNKRNPMYIDLEESDPPSLEFKELEEKYSRNSKSWLSAQQSDEPYYFNEDKSLIAIFIKPKQASTNLDFTNRVIADVKTQIDGMDLSKYGPIKIEFTGGYQKKVDTQKLMQDDLGVVSIVALVLVLGYLLLHFRRLEAIVLIITPLCFGLLMTFAYAQIVFGQLNILSAFIGVILLGLGIDHGIHLLSRFIDEQKKGSDLDTSIVNTFTRTGRAVAVASLTTFVTFLGLGFSEFRAFFEFGMIAAGGMVLVTLAYLVMMPPLLNLAMRFTWNIKTEASSEASMNRIAAFLEKRTVFMILLGLAAWIAMGITSTGMKFNYDFESLGNTELRSFKLNSEVNTLLGYSQAPMLALTSNKEEERYVMEQLQKGMDDPEFKSGLDFVLATSDLVPQEQEEKQNVLQKINRLTNKVKDSWLETAEEREGFASLKRMLNTEPFSYPDLPRETQLLFGSKNGEAPTDGILMLFPSVKQTDGQAVLDLAKELRAAKQSDGERTTIAGEPMILADILTLVFEESPKVLAFCGIMILAILWIFMRSFYLAVLSLIPAISTLTLTFGVMALFDLELNYINLAMIPVLLGVSVDSGVHMVGRAMDGHDLHTIVGETGSAIFGSIVTSGLGIGALLLTGHAGLNSLAQIGTIGLVINLIVSIFFLPALLAWRPVKVVQNT